METSEAIKTDSIAESTAAAGLAIADAADEIK